METKLAYTLPRIRISSSAKRINSDLKGKQAKHDPSKTGFW